jgi:hypothetical protein
MVSVALLLNAAFPVQATTPALENAPGVHREPVPRDCLVVPTVLSTLIVTKTHVSIVLLVSVPPPELR